MRRRWCPSRRPGGGRERRWRRGPRRSLDSWPQRSRRRVARGNAARRCSQVRSSVPTRRAARQLPRWATASSAEKTSSRRSGASSPPRRAPRSLLLSGDAGHRQDDALAGGRRARGSRRVTLVLATRPLEAEAKLAYARPRRPPRADHDGARRAPDPAGARASRRAPPRGARNRGRSTSARSRSASSAFCVRSRGSQPGARRGRRPAVARSARPLARSSSPRAGSRSRVGFLLALRSEARAELPFSPEQVFPGFDELPTRVRSRSRTCTRSSASALGLVLSRPALRDGARDGEREPVLRARARAHGRSSEAGGPHARSSAPPMPPDAARADRRPDRRSARRHEAGARGDGSARRSDGRARRCRDGLRCGRRRSAPRSSRRSSRSRPGRIRFAHPLLGAAAYGGVDAGDRRDLHVALAGARRAIRRSERDTSRSRRRPGRRDRRGARRGGERSPRRAERRSLRPSCSRRLLALTPRARWPDAAPAARGRGGEPPLRGRRHAAGRGRCWTTSIPRLPPGVERARALIMLARVRSLRRRHPGGGRAARGGDRRGRGRAARAGPGPRDPVRHPLPPARAVRRGGRARAAAVAIGRLSTTPSSSRPRSARSAPRRGRARRSAGAGDPRDGGCAGLGGTRHRARWAAPSSRSRSCSMWWERARGGEGRPSRACSTSGGGDRRRELDSVHPTSCSHRPSACAGAFAEAAAHADEGRARAEQAGQETLQALRARPAGARRGLRRRRGARARGGREGARAGRQHERPSRQSSSRPPRSACSSSRSSATPRRPRCSHRSSRSRASRRCASRV